MAERLTKKTPFDGIQFNTCTSQTNPKFLSKVKKKMFAYESLGTVEELSEMVKAKQDGRCVVLPCKVGDTVYVDTKTLPTNDSGKFGQGCENPKYAPAEVISIRKNKNGWFVKVRTWLEWLNTKRYEDTGPETFYDECLSRNFVYRSSAFGKTVFLTLEEAEAAKEGNDERD